MARSIIRPYSLAIALAASFAGASVLAQTPDGATGREPSKLNFGAVQSSFEPLDSEPSDVRLVAALGLDDAADAIKSTFQSGVDKIKGAATNPATKHDPVSLNSEIGPPTPDYHVAVARLKEQTGHQREAIEQYEKALRLDSKHLGALLSLARLYDREGRFADANKHYERATKHHPQSAVALNDAGLCLARQGRLNQAAIALRRSVELDPKRELYRNNLATVLIRQGEVKDAVANLMEVHSAAVSHYNAGFLLQQNGRPDLAVEQFQLSLRADPRFEPSRRWLQSLSTGGPSFDAPMNGAAQSTSVDSYQPSARRRNDSPPAMRQNAATETLLPSRQATPQPAYRHAPVVEELRGPAIVAPGMQNDQASVPPTPDTMRQYFNNAQNSAPNYRKVELLPPVGEHQPPRRY